MIYYCVDCYYYFNFEDGSCYKLIDHLADNIPE